MGEAWGQRLVFAVLPTLDGGNLTGLPPVPPSQRGFEAPRIIPLFQGHLGSEENGEAVSSSLPGHPPLPPLRSVLPAPSSTRERGSGDPCSLIPRSIWEFGPSSGRRSQGSFFSVTRHFSAFPMSCLLSHYRESLLRRGGEYPCSCLRKIKLYMPLAHQSEGTESMLSEK